MSFCTVLTAPCFTKLSIFSLCLIAHFVERFGLAERPSSGPHAVRSGVAAHVGFIYRFRRADFGAVAPVALNSL